MTPNPDEVEQLFSVPLNDLLNKNNWVIRDFSTPVFTGGPFVIWGLTAYLLNRFLKDVVSKCSGQENEFNKKS
jgi:nudix motif 8